MTSKEQTRNLIIKYLDNSFTEEELKVFLHMIREGDADMDALDDVTPENLPKLGKITVDLGSIKRSEMVLSRFRGFCEATMTAL